MSSLSIGSYQFGDMLGRGASGSVYRALNFLTGETVAIKSVSLLTLSPTALPDIMSEIDLLKNLNHPNIVKYKGFARDKESLHIILEYCENGSLQTILKKFGKFPESLVAVYMSQVLEGLIYLHEQGVIHRDIKGANILTNKDGSVKLADFGVSSRTAGPALDKDGEDLEVVGSPYWMAPEVIEQSGSSTASDIWSVGCVVVELLEGQPPHGELAPMQALWRIVQDESMRIPEGASPIVKDFLYHCFQKDPNLRISAKKLAKHPWMLSARKSDSPTTASPADPAPRAVSKAQPPAPSTATGRDAKKGETKVRTTSDEKPGQPATVYDEAVMRVRQWNEALNASPTRKGSVRRSASSAESPRKPSQAHAGHTKKPSESHPLATLFKQPALPTRTSADSLVAEPSTSAEPSPLRPPNQGPMHVNDVLSKAKESEGPGESWDDDFASDVSFANLTRRNDVNEDEGPDQSTIRPIRSPTPGGQSSARQKIANASRAVSSSAVDDWSDLALDEDAGGLAAKMANLKMRNKTQKGILHPNDLRKLRQAAPPPLPSPRVASTPVQETTSVSAPATPLLPSPSALSVTSPRPLFRSPPNSRQNSYRTRTESAESHPELHKYTENDDEDYSDIFDKHTSSESTLTKSLQLTKRSNKSWLGDEDGDELDPFAEIEDDFDTEDLETNVLRDKRATMCTEINKLIDDLVPKSNSTVLKAACDGLISLLDNAHEDLGLEDHFISSHGMLAVLEILEEKLSRDVAVRLLKIVNIIVTSNVDALEAFCLVGGIPVIIPYTSKRHSLATRLEAATFIQQLTRSALPLQMFISCRGLKVLVELLDEDYTVNKTLILSSLEGIASVFELQSPTPRNDFCRMFVREGILDPLSTSILSTMRDEEADPDDSCARAIGILLLFSQVAQADSRVRDAFANRSVMIRLLEACSTLPRNLLVTAIKAIKHLATSPQLIETLQNSMAMTVLVTLLGRSINKAHGNEIGSHIFQTIYSMTRLSKIRQEEAASAGIIPLLKTVIEGKSPLKPFALPVLCDMANAGKVSRRQLWRVNGLNLYLNLLSDPYWRVSALDAILAWMQDETARVEDVLLESEASQSIMMCFTEASGVSFEGILDPLLKILRLSTSVTTSVSQPPLFRHLAASLARPVKAVTKLNLLRLTRVFFEAHADVVALSRYGVREVVERLSRQDEAVLVRELAKEILPSLGHRPVPVARTVQREPMRSSTSKATAIPSTAFSSSTTTTSHSSRSSSMAPPPVPDRSSSYNLPSPSRRTAASPISSHGAGYRQASTTSSSGSRGIGSNGSTVISDPGQRAESLRSPEPSAARKHKRQISRALVHDVSWQNDENGQLKMVRKSSK